MVPGGRLHFDALGYAEPPLVLVHGYCGSGLDFADVRRDLARRRRVVRIDQRGHGRSGRAPSYSVEKLVADLGVALEQLGGPRVDLLGHSMGGMVALRQALRRSELIRSLILVSTSAEPAPLASVPVPPVGLPRRVKARLARVLGRDPAARLAAEVRGGRQARRRFLALTRAGHRAVDPRATVQLGEDFGRLPSVLEALEDLRVPTLVLVGAEDARFLGPSRRLAAALPEAELVVVPGAGHYPQIENRKRWLEAVERHLEAARGR